MARRIRLPRLGDLRELPDAIRARRNPSAAPPAPSATPPQPPAATPQAPATPPSGQAPPATSPQPPPTTPPSEQPTAAQLPVAPEAAATPIPPAPAPVAPAAASAPATDPAAPGTPSSPPPPPSPPGRLRRARNPVLIGLAVLLAAGAGFGAGYLLFDDEDPAPPPPVAPTVVVEPGPDQPETTATSLGFPGFATLNTTRVGGADATAVAAGAALAAYPSEGEVGRPRIVTIAPAGSWQAGIAASPLTSAGVGGPLLLSEPDEVPDVTAQALTQLDPTGLKRADGTELVVVGNADAPGDLDALNIAGSDPAALANEIDKQREQLSGVKDPDHILVVSSKEADYAMPAAAWAARSGDPVVFADGSDVPGETLEVLERHPEAPVYVLGPDSVITAKAVKELAAAPGGSDQADTDTPAGERKVVRVGADDPVENAIEFARFVDGTFGWNINDPGHGFVIANTSRPEDAAAAAPLSATAKPGPLLLTDDADVVPKALEGFLLDTKPGYVDDPTRAIYNHVWVVGDDAAISIPFQAEVDRLTELAKVSEGTGLPELGPKPGTPEPESQAKTRP